MSPDRVYALLGTSLDAADELAEKSRELVLMLAAHAADPFSRSHFTPGHVTATAVVLHPASSRFLLVHHRRLDRWLLPGGHIEPGDRSLEDAARREAVEETGARIAHPLGVVGVDVHGIPPGKGEPYHLHHDVIFGFIAASDGVLVSPESRAVVWAERSECDRYDIAQPILRAVLRAMERQAAVRPELLPAQSNPANRET